MYNKSIFARAKFFMMLYSFFFKIQIDMDNRKKNFRGKKPGKGEYFNTANFHKCKLEFEEAKRLCGMPFNLLMI